MNAPLPQAAVREVASREPLLFQPGRIGDIDIANRVVMAPLTRSRADEAAGDIPGSAMNVEYYRQRANAGLIISEGTPVSPVGKGYMATPGIYSDAQVEGWKAITQAVHEAGSKIVAQIWHVGRVTHPGLIGGAQPVAPSAVQPKGVAYTHRGKVELPVPHALTVEEIAEVVQQFRRGAANALRAGFDGVEIHGANGYLIDQFLRDGANRRTDAYGGSVQNRVRFALEVVDAVVAEIGAGRVGIRLSPVTPANDLSDSNPQAVFGHLVEELNRRGIAFIHFVEGATGGARDLPGFDYAWARRSFKGAYIANNGYDRDSAIEAVASGHADAVAFGRAYIANPDLVQRFKLGAALNTPNPQTFYVPGPVGYIDYPALEQSAREETAAA
ncbi:alkene reductase [Azohydromonas caseinilytica]|uniref:Alkene reductase n=1 Tax=Azohydromonas caseinilytica TaxID=2728836 RepID=A0A848FCP2_9BURK|nr:alkene reductase [Azohydromonas caseinilytica]NML17244.1 alkene reductase [Azohydromonas caseinilytica]